MKSKHPTCASIVLEAMVKRDTFLQRDEVVSITGLTRDQVIATLMHLSKYRALGVYVDEQGTWYYPTPEDDTRIRKLDLIKDNIKRNRRPKAARKEHP